MSRYVRLLYHQLRASVLLSAQYRADFLIDAAIEVLWAGLAVVPLLIVFGQRSDVAGWTFGEALLVTGFFTLAPGRARRRHPAQPQRGGRARARRAPSTSCCSSPPTRSSWCPPRASHRGAPSTTALAGLCILSYALSARGRAFAHRPAPCSPRLALLVGAVLDPVLDLDLGGER
jgi:ABC-2 type transport system permease protein